MTTWTPYPFRLSPGDRVLTGEDDPWGEHYGDVRPETVQKVTRRRITTDAGTYYRRGRQTRLQPLLYPRRILSVAVAD